MRLFKAIIKQSETRERVLEFVPPKFELGTPEVAQEYLERKVEGEFDFSMHDSVRVQTGVDKIEAQSMESQIEERTLERLQDTQEKAYQEAYQLGLDEGRTEAFQQTHREIVEKLETLEALLNNVAEMKKDLVGFNETHLVKLAYHMAKKLAMKELVEDPTTLVEVLKTAVARVQEEEDVVLRISEQQHEFISTLRTESKRELDFLKNVKIEADPTITPGGCVIQTNYGEIDARIEERLSNLWDAIVEASPKVKDKIAG